MDHPTDCFIGYVAAFFLAEFGKCIPKNVLDIDLKPDVYCKGIAELCELSELEKAYHIRHSDGRELGSILKYGTSDQPSATKE